ncbi:MAG: AtpZ/AtpI family protein [Intrasporangiaceae bacterium]|nr:AtpZ/AtpI family protein [Intrasporangiaceae bacterium]
MSPERPSAYSPHSDDGARSGPSDSFQADAMGSTVIAYLVTGPLVFGGLGWLITRWTDITLFIPVGMLAGMALSLYTIWLRYGRT